MLKKVLGILLAVLAIAIVLIRSAGGTYHPDLLAYTLRDGSGKTSLRMYDPQFGVSVPVYTDPNPISFSLSADGRLAFASGQDGVGQLHILDTVSGQSSLIGISPDVQRSTYPVAWSPDGRYLAFASYNNAQREQLYVWDGKTATNITPNGLADNAGIHYDMTWGFDDRLAFTVFYPHGNTPLDDPDEIYLWDGKTTTNLSQNSIGHDNSPSWSTDGRLAFTSQRNGRFEYDILIWDGHSLKNGVPDVYTFTTIAPNLAAYYSSPVWTNRGLLTFTSADDQAPDTQIFLWDGKTEADISQNPTMNNGGQAWSADGRWAFSTFYSANQLVYVRDAQNNPLLTVEGQQPAWSPDGYLTFCAQTGTAQWTLYLWDGLRITKIAQGDDIVAQWGNGSGNVCSSG